MRVFSRIVLVVFAVLALSAAAAFGQQTVASCPLQLVAANPPSTAFYLSPHGVFRNGNLVYVLRGQTLTTYTVNDLGDLQVGREDFVGALGARDSNGGIAYANGFLYVSSEAGLEILDLRSTRPGGLAPSLISRTPGLHYRRLAASGNILAALFPATDLPCAPQTVSPMCTNSIDLFNVSNPAAPVRVGSLNSYLTSAIAWNDIKFNYGYLVATGIGGTYAYDISNPGSPSSVGIDSTPGLYLISNGANLLSVGTDNAVLTYIVGNPASGAIFFNPFEYHTIGDLGINRANPIAFHHGGWIDDQTGRLVMMVDEVDRETLQPARTIAFDVFDYFVPMYEGKDPRYYEQISYTDIDEVKHNPTSVGGDIYVIGELSGLQSYGVCGQMTGHIAWSSPAALPCGGAEIHGWVTGATKIANVELFLDGGSLGAASLGGPPVMDVPSTTPVTPWRINVNLDQTTAGEHILRAVGTDINGNRRQFASQRVVFAGPGSNCFLRRRGASK